VAENVRELVGYMYDSTSGSVPATLDCWRDIIMLMAVSFCDVCTMLRMVHECDMLGAGHGQR
jgi:hypothetical protein